MIQQELFENLVSDAEVFLDRLYSNLALEELSQNPHPEIAGGIRKLSVLSMAGNWSSMADWSKNKDGTRKKVDDPLFYCGIEVTLVELGEAIRHAATRLLEKRLGRK